jgi:hypothetical protein
VPKNMSEKQKDALKGFAQASGESISDSSSVFKKVFG